MSSEVRPIRAASHKEAANQGTGATNRRKPDPHPFMLRTVRESQPADHVQGMERLTAQPVEAVSPEMEPTMSIRNILMTTAALAMLTPVIAPTASSAAGGFAANAAAGMAASPRGAAAGGAPAAAAPAGGGVHVGGGGGGGWSHGGVAA